MFFKKHTPIKIFKLTLANIFYHGSVLKSTVFLYLKRSVKSYEYVLYAYFILDKITVLVYNIKRQSFYAVAR